MRHEQIGKPGTYEVHELADFEFGLAQPKTPFHSAAAAPDIPVAVGRLLVAAYVALLATFAVTMAHSREALLALAICAVFLTMYLSVPRIFFGVEPKQGKRPSLDTFLEKGLETYTGHCTGKEAMVQMLIVPVLLTLCALVMGVIALGVL
jgi:hypothetical protein